MRGRHPRLHQIRYGSFSKFFDQIIDEQTNAFTFFSKKSLPQGNIGFRDTDLSGIKIPGINRTVSIDIPHGHYLFVIFLSDHCAKSYTKTLVDGEILFGLADGYLDFGFMDEQSPQLVPEITAQHKKAGNQKYITHEIHNQTVHFISWNPV